MVGKRLGRKVDIQSGFRSAADQQRLYDLFLAGDGAPANPPGRSLHEKGLAVDANIDGTNFWDFRGVRTLAGKYGLKQPYAHEPWHVEKV